MNDAEGRVMFLEGDRVHLRTHIPADVQVWHAWFNDPEVTDGMFKGLFPNTAEKQRRFFETMYDSEANLQLAILFAAEQRLIGTIGLHGIDFFHRHADISILIGEKDFWGRGLGREALEMMVDHAFGKLSLHKLTGGMYAVNEASLRLFESVGFKREAVFREQAMWRGRFIDVYKYGLLAREWFAIKGTGGN